MKTFAAGLAIGILIGFYVTSGQCRDKLDAIKTQQEEAQIELALAYSKTAEVWRDRLDAVNAGPVAIERVPVKVDCVPATGSAGVDDGAGTVVAGLAESAVESLAGVIQNAESKYRACSYRLRAFQDMHNKE